VTAASVEARKSAGHSVRDPHSINYRRIGDRGPSAPVNERYCVIEGGPYWPRKYFSTVTECENYCIERNLDYFIDLVIR